MANICQTCGDQGFVEALIYCDSCKIDAVHRYCLNITPVPFEDYITWFCVNCDGSDSGFDREEVDQTAKLRHILKTSEKEKKKKKTKKNSNHTQPVLAVRDYGLEYANNVEPMKVSSSATNETRKQYERREISDSRKPHELTESVLETSEKKKKKKKSSNHTLPVVALEDHGLQDATNVEPLEVSSSTAKETRKESERRGISDSGKPQELNGSVRNGASVLETSEKKKKKKSSNHTQPILAVEDHGLQDVTNVEPAEVSSSPTKETRMISERREISDRGKPHKWTGLGTNGVSVLEPGNSPSVQDYDSCTSKKRKLCSGYCDEEPTTFKPRTPLGASNDRSYRPLTSENRQFDVGKSSCKETGSNMPQTSKGLTDRHFNTWALIQDKAQPIIKPIWKGSISVKEGSICSIDGLVAHLSSLACHRVHDTASSLHARLFAEIFPRLEIWPKSFLKNGGAKDESIALYFFPSSESNEKVFDALILEMKKNDYAMRCVLDNAELLLFTSYMLPMPSWSFRSKEYLWGVFRAKQTCRR